MSSRRLELFCEPDDALGLVGRLDSLQAQDHKRCPLPNPSTEPVNHEGNLKWAADLQMP